MSESLLITEYLTISVMQTQVGGDHYKSLKIQPLEYALANDLGICEHAVIKYVSRWKQKGGIDDLRKAKHYIDIMIEGAMHED